jgi:hypothetical protein
MARLGSLATLRRRRPPALRRPRRILAGRHRGVARVAVQALLELRDARRQLGDLRILCGKPRRQRQEHSHNGLASLLVDRLRLGALHSAQFSRAGGVPSDLQHVEACHFAPDGPRVTGTERLPEVPHEQALFETGTGQVRRTCTRGMELQNLCLRPRNRDITPRHVERVFFLHATPLPTNRRRVT